MAKETFPPVFLVVILAASGAVSVLLPPENVRIVSENLALQLIWDPPVNTSLKLVTYTTQYKGVSDHFKPVCVNKSETTCDVTSEISPFGTYELRVRAEQKELFSDWVVKDPFVVNERTNISAPRVKVLSHKGNIEVQISDPVMRINSFRDMYQPVEYIITYWREGHTHRLVERSKQSHVILPGDDLQPEGRYCVQVHINMTFYKKTSSASSPTCITIAPDDKMAGWVIMLVMLGSFLTVVMGLLLIFVLAWYSYHCLQYIHPKANLPEHFFKQHFFSQMEQAKWQPVELCHQLSIIMETAQPPLLEGGAHCNSQLATAAKGQDGGSEGTIRLD